MQEYKESIQQLHNKYNIERDCLKQEQAQVCCQVEQAGKWGLFPKCSPHYQCDSYE